MIFSIPFEPDLRDIKILKKLYDIHPINKYSFYIRVHIFMASQRKNFFFVTECTLSTLLDIIYSHSQWCLGIAIELINEEDFHEDLPKFSFE